MCKVQELKEAIDQLTEEERCDLMEMLKPQYDEWRSQILDHVVKAK